MNLYVTVDEFKRELNIDANSNEDDALVRNRMESACRQLDAYCMRRFYVMNEANKFSARGGEMLFLASPSDLISIDTDGLKTDDNEDRTFETTWATTDYDLLPANADPATAGNPMSRPYTKIGVAFAGTKAAWPNGVNTVQIAGKWGYWQHLKTAAETADAIADATTTSVTVSERTDVEAGHTILIDTEQLFVESYAGSTLTVKRGVNGTTAASHTGGDTIQIYEYPPQLSAALLLHAGRLMKRIETRGVNTIGFTEAGALSVSNRMDIDVMQLVSSLRRTTGQVIPV